jgi:hypothetical protein
MRTIAYHRHQIYAPLPGWCYWQQLVQSYGSGMAFRPSFMQIWILPSSALYRGGRWFKTDVSGLPMESHLQGSRLRNTVLPRRKPWIIHANLSVVPEDVWGYSVTWCTVKLSHYSPLGLQEVEASRISIQSVYEGGKIVGPTLRPPLPLTWPPPPSGKIPGARLS